MEFAIVGPAFLLVLLAMFDFAFQLAVDLALNFGTSAAARYAVTGAVTGTVAGPNGKVGSNDANNATIASRIFSSTGGWLDLNRINVSATSYSSPSSYIAGTGNAAGSNGSSGSVVVYSVTYDQPFLTGIPTLIAWLSHSSGPDSGITHHATVIVQNEPY